MVRVFLQCERPGFHLYDLRFDPLENGMATHSVSCLCPVNSRTEAAGRLQSRGVAKVRRD